MYYYDPHGLFFTILGQHPDYCQVNWSIPIIYQPRKISSRQKNRSIGNVILEIDCLEDFTVTSGLKKNLQTAVTGHWH